MIKNNLKHILVDRNMSLAKLAREAGIHYTTLYNFAQDETTSIHKETLDRVCETLGIHPGDIFIYVPEE